MDTKLARVTRVLKSLGIDMTLAPEVLYNSPSHPQVEQVAEELNNEANVLEALAETVQVKQDMSVKTIMKTRTVQCSSCRAQFATLECKKLHTCNWVMDVKIIAEGNIVRRRQKTNKIQPFNNRKQVEEVLPVARKKHRRDQIPVDNPSVNNSIKRIRWDLTPQPPTPRSGRKRKSILKTPVKIELMQSSSSSITSELKVKLKVARTPEPKVTIYVYFTSSSPQVHQKLVTFRVPASRPMHRVVRKMAAKMGVGQEKLLLLVGEQEVVGDQLARDFHMVHLTAKIKEVTSVDIRLFPVLLKIEPTIDLN